MVSPTDLLDIRRGVVIAPAGCGKTQFLVGSVKANPAGRVLVLTHTRAGIAAIRARLRKAEVPQQALVQTRGPVGYAGALNRQRPAMDKLQSLEETAGRRDPQGSPERP